MTTETDPHVPAEQADDYQTPTSVIGLMELARKFQDAGHRPASGTDVFELSRRWMRIAP